MMEGQQLSAAVDDVIRALYLTLLGREPDQEGLDHYKRMHGSSSWVHVLQGITGSAEFVGRVATREREREACAEESRSDQDGRKRILEHIYLAFFGRGIDEGGLAAYAHVLGEIDGVERVLTSILSSNEMMSKWGEKQNASRPQFVPDVKTISFLTERYLERNANGEDQVACDRSGEPIAGRGFAKCVASSMSLRARRIRPLLLFGAYGNGNLGDAYQALAVAQLLKKAWRLEEARLFACSLLSNKEFPYFPNQILPGRSFLDERVVNDFEALVVGGGGLLAHPHEPLLDERWIRGIHIPIVLLGIGADRELALRHRTLLERAWFVSGRDAESVNALRGIRNDASLCPDPLLAAACSVDLMCSDRTDVKPSSPRRRFLFVLKYPGERNDEDFIKLVDELLVLGLIDGQIVAIEPDRDRVLERLVVSKVRYVTDARELNQLISLSTAVATMRYHGAVFGLTQRKRVIGFSQRKIADLLGDWSVRGKFVNRPEDLLKELTTESPPSCVKYRKVGGTLNTVLEQIESLIAGDWLLKGGRKANEAAGV
jgi:polysaccharide pyruvyl transferase WcaK-like protein